MIPLIYRLSIAKPSQALRFALLLAVYFAVLLCSLWVSFQLRFEFNMPVEQASLFEGSVKWLIPLALAALWIAGQFRSLLTYFSVPDMIRIVKSQAAVCVLSLTVWYLQNGQRIAPRSILLMHFLLSIMGLIAFRLGLRLMRERYHKEAAGTPTSVARVAVIGATDVGAHLVKEMKHRPDMRMNPVAVFDTNPKRWGWQIHGVPILGSYPLLFAAKTDLNLTEVVIADPAISQAELRKLVHQLAEIGLRCKVAPSTDLRGSNGNYQPQIRAVEIEDLLGRDPVDLQTDKIRELIAGQCVAVSGAGGSIGSELCSKILEFGPRQLVLIEQCEVQLFAIEQKLLQAKPAVILTPCVADILDETRIRGIFRQHAPAIVFHAAAHKHVPMMESQPAEAFQNNVIGTMRLAEAARESGCDRFVLISSDKAINPTNVMGATKRLAEMYVQALQVDARHATKFMAVRFGNVLGSSGSVIPSFKRQIATGGPVTVTHPEITRYFMVTREAIGLVLQCATQGQGGEIFVLKMGSPIKIVDLARQMIELSGLRPEIDIEIAFTGLRAGEKLFEELNHHSEQHAPTSHSEVMRFTGPAVNYESLCARLQDLHRRSHSLTEAEMKFEIRNIVPEYQPHLDEPKMESSQIIGAPEKSGMPHRGPSIGLASGKWTPV